MENFGNIKDTFKKIIIESTIKKDNVGKKLFTKYLKTLKENKTLRDQFLIYKNLETKKFDDRFEAKEYLKENIELLKSIGKKNLDESNNYLLKLLKGKKIVKENDELKQLSQKQELQLAKVVKVVKENEELKEKLSQLLNLIN